MVLALFQLAASVAIVVLLLVVIAGQRRAERRAEQRHADTLTTVARACSVFAEQLRAVAGVVSTPPPEARPAPVVPLRPRGDAGLAARRHNDAGEAGEAGVPWPSTDERPTIWVEPKDGDDGDGPGAAE